MPFRGIRAIAASLEDSGQNWTTHIHKTGGPTSFGVGRWGDASMGAGSPKYNAYVGTQNAATPLIGAGNDGIYVGSPPPLGQTKHLFRMLLLSGSSTVAPAVFVLCDYLMHYPLTDGDDTTQQDMDNTAALPRYQNGDGVMLMAVCTTPMVANATLEVRYTNQAGVPGRLSTCQILASTVVGAIVSASNNSGLLGAASPYLPLQSGDTGVRSIQSATMLTPSGGFFALVMVKPITQIELRESNVATEKRFVQQHINLPRIFDGAYLNFIFNSGQSGSIVPLRGELEFAWR